MTLDDLRAAIAEARSRYLDPEARPNVILRVWRKTPPKGMRLRIMPGVMAEIVGEDPAPDSGWWVTVRAFCDDLDRYIAREAAE